MSMLRVQAGRPEGVTPDRTVAQWARSDVVYGYELARRPDGPLPPRGSEQAAAGDAAALDKLAAHLSG
jgi:hypothetical protein